MLTSSADNPQCKSIDFIARTHTLKARLDDLAIWAKVITETTSVKLSNGAILKLNTKKHAALTGDVLRDPLAKDLWKLAKAVNVLAQQANIFVTDAEVVGAVAALSSALDTVTHGECQPSRDEGQLSRTPSDTKIKEQPVGWGARQEQPQQPQQQASPIFTTTKPPKQDTPRFDIPEPSPQKPPYGQPAVWAAKPAGAQSKFKVRSGLP